MTLMRRNPYDPFYEIDRAMNQMWNRMRSLMNDSLLPFDDVVQPQDANWLAVDVSSDDRHVFVRTALPGFKQDEIHVDVQGSMLTITAESRAAREDHRANWHIREMRYGKFARSVMLPEEVVTDKADATLENGILTVKLPKQKPSPIQRIAVKARNLLTGGSKS
jgi:HSP20 family protein